MASRLTYSNFTLFVFVLLGMSFVSHSKIELYGSKNSENLGEFTVSGYVKLDARHVNGDVPYQDYWLGNFPGSDAQSTSHTEFNVKESRLKFEMQHSDVRAVFEWDFYGGGGNQVVSNSSNVRVRNLYITYKNWMVGQNWTTFMSLAALPESIDFAGPTVAEAFVRQGQIRYTSGNWQFAIENPETNGDGDIGSNSSGVGVTGDQADSDESIPDLVVRYNAKGDWGTVSFSSLLRKVDQGGLDEVSFAGNIGGRIKTFGQDDLRFQVSFGSPGRYVGPGLTADVVSDLNGQQQVERTSAFVLAYRHFWNDSWRSTAYYGQAKTDTLQRKRSHAAVNLMTQINDKLVAGAEFGKYSIQDVSIDDIHSLYTQVSVKYSF